MRHREADRCEPRFATSVRIPPEPTCGETLQPSAPQRSSSSGRARAFAGEPVSLETALREARAANAHLPLPALDIEHRERKGERGPRRDVAEGRPRGRLRLRAPRLRGAPDEPRQRAPPGGRPAADLRGRIAQGGRRPRRSRRRGGARPLPDDRDGPRARGPQPLQRAPPDRLRDRDPAHGARASSRPTVRRCAAGRPRDRASPRTCSRPRSAWRSRRRRSRTPSSGATTHACR